jgi:hypothetical protein
MATRLHMGPIATLYIELRHGPHRKLPLSVPLRSIIILLFHLPPSNIEMDLREIDRLDLREIGNVFNLLY